MKHKRSHPGIELGLPILFPTISEAAAAAAVVVVAAAVVVVVEMSTKEIDIWKNILKN